MLIGVLAFVVLMLAAITLHEYGHFSTAKLFGIKCSQFFVGFGPTLWSRRTGRTEVYETADGELSERPELEYGIKAIPLGGFVRITGMSALEDVPPEDRPRSFQSAKHWQRAVVLFAGSATHVISAFLVFFLVFSILGFEDPTKSTLTLQEVAPKVDSRPGPAFTAGLGSGDTVTAVNGRSVKSWEEFRKVIRASGGQAVSVTVRNKDKRVRIVEITPILTEQDGNPVGLVGVSPAAEITRMNPIKGVWMYVVEVGTSIKMFVVYLPKTLNLRALGLIPGAKVAPEERASSIVGVAGVAGSIASELPLSIFLAFFARISLFIGLFNLLPLPPLDGGHLLLLGLEKLRRKPLSARAQTATMMAGFILIVAVGLALVFRDIVDPVHVNL